MEGTAEMVSVLGHYLASPPQQTPKALPQNMGMEKEMAPHSSTLAWKIPWMEEPDGRQSMGLLRVGHDCGTELN